MQSILRYCLSNLHVLHQQFLHFIATNSVERKTNLLFRHHKKILVSLFMNFLFVVVCKAQTEEATPQKDLIDIGRKLFYKAAARSDTNTQKRVYFSFLPTGSSNGVPGAVFITSTTAGFYLGDPQKTFISTITFAPYWNFKSRFGLPLRSNIWLKNNVMTIQGDTRFLVYPQLTYGLNGGASSSDRILLNAKYIRFYQSALFRIKTYLFAGIGYNLDNHLDIETNSGANIKTVTTYPFGTATDFNSISSGFNLNLLYDTRNNLLNPLPGSYINIVYRYNPIFMGSDNTWQSLYVDLRKYVSLSKSRHQLFAFWMYYWTTLSGNTPYLDLPSIGWDPYNRSGRGIPQGRFRGQHLLYGEAEFRSNITDDGLLGFVLFGNLNAVTQPQTYNFVYFHPAEGFGLRMKFNKRSNTNIALDFARSSGFHTISFNLGEAF